MTAATITLPVGVLWSCAPIFLLGAYIIVAWIADGFVLLDQWMRARLGRRP